MAVEKKNIIIYGIRIAVASVTLIISIAAFFGVYGFVKIFDIQIVSLLQRIFIDFKFGGIVTLILILLLTVFFGRIYCSTLCPFGILQEFIAFILRKKNKFRKNYILKYITTALIFGTLAGGTVAVIKFFDPYTLFGSAATFSAIGIIALVLVIIAAILKNRIFCTDLCPVGTVLGLISKISPNKIHLKQKECLSCGICAKFCPSGCIDPANKTVDNETCIKCLKCLSVCPGNNIEYGTIKTESKQTFSPMRRDFILAGSMMAIFAAATAAGIKIKEFTKRTFSNIILPPGAGNASDFVDKCLNCNLCVEICPEHIIEKANSDYPAVHLNLSKGSCRFDCNKCSSICPSGAIKRLTKTQKQSTKIASAYITSDSCSNCNRCTVVCMAGAITKENGKAPVTDENKCIGCGACKNDCPSKIIEIKSIPEQKFI